jgi:uncharacterized OB-fold protein
MPEEPIVPPIAQRDDWVTIYPGVFNYPLSEGEKPALLANQCRRCGKNYFPKRTICPHCIEQDLQDLTLAQRGIIYASTVVHIDSHAGIKAPYTFGYVDIPENHIRVFALFTGSDPSSFVPGVEVELVLEPIGTNDAGQTIIAYKFKRVA